MKTLPRDLSWLRFNARVLQEAQCPTVPLLERLKFLAIFSANLDEFFKVRVATLRRLVKLKKKTRAQLPGGSPKRILAEVLAEVHRQQEEFGHTFRDVLLPALQAAGIRLLTSEELTEAQCDWVKAYFEANVRNLLSPVVLDDTLHQLFLKDQAVYLTFDLTEPLAKTKKADAERVVIMELPTKRHGGRFVALPGAAGTAEDPHLVLFLDDVVRAGAASLFPAYGRVQVNAIKLSRDAELDIAEEVSGDLMAKIKSSLAKRATGYPARLLFDPATPKSVLKAIKQKTGIEDEELVEGSRYHNFRDFFGFPNFGRQDLLNPEWPELPHPSLPRTGPLLPAIARRDHLLHPPFQSFDVVPRLLREAAHDPRVSAISLTLYRVAPKSAVAKALLKAVKNGKQVTVVVELKARFDEESNMYWAEKLQRAGAHVIFTPPELKCHAKLLLITRRDEADDEPAVGVRPPQRYAYLSSGNFNEATAHLYADHGLFTANPEITAEVDQVFRYFITGEEPSHLQHLLVAPFTLRKQLLKLIAAEASRAKHGEEAYILLKVNSLEDPGMIAALYAASQAGVRIELLIRGIGCLVPGEPGLSETISQRGLLDRYLEHARIYVFANGGDEKVFVSSADWMTRNLDRRVEAAFPLLDDTLRAEIRHLLDLERQDNVKARDFDNHYILPAEGQPLVRAQEAERQYLKKLAGRKRAVKTKQD
ncbi:polyphosphate kinase 1 [Hymenobacter ginsengisoli]|uniref:Polyphosphate kinase n=1 Tax=Hymenobacter ginsengisoli TaxID=1051626 RepID=A0ABP8QCX0_9BACT|nr:MULTISPECIES: polyphosphate kinase 1 [unclassified Hymenobacter]MBO2031997.1 polyphosphate kinase 1 [Hymenobacter sp. BT559]